jgi:hypothetical protein
MDFSLLMFGFLNVEKAGEYTFFCGSNDGSSMRINDTLLIENDGTHGFCEPSGDIYLSKGTLLIEIRYFQAGGAYQLKASWQGPDFAKHELFTE